MNLKYKLNGKKVNRAQFLLSVSAKEQVQMWETAANKFPGNNNEKEDVSLILHMSNGKLKIITDTYMLTKLYCEVYKNIPKNIPKHAVGV